MASTSAAGAPTTQDPSGPSLPPNVIRLPATKQLQGIFTIIRDETTPRGEFVFYASRITRLLCEEGLNHLPVRAKLVQTPTGLPYQGVEFVGGVCGVSIIRAGESMEVALRECCRSVRIGKMLIQRDEETAKPKLFYSKLPEDIAERWVLLLDPMLATGGSVIKAIEVLEQHGVPLDKILFLNLISSPEGLRTVSDRFPQVRIVTGWVDEGLSDKKFIEPGLGDFGDRYYHGG